MPPVGLTCYDVELGCPRVKESKKTVSFSADKRTIVFKFWCLIYLSFYQNGDFLLS